MLIDDEELLDVIPLLGALFDPNGPLVPVGNECLPAKAAEG